MARQSAKTIKSNARTWKDIDQEVKPKAMSAASWKLLLRTRAKRVALGVAAVAVAVAGLRLVLVADSGPRLLVSAGQQLPIVSVQTQTDGVLGQDWIVAQLGLGDAENNLLTVNVLEMKQQLEAQPQIKRADVVKRYPDGLFVSIEERDPVARILAQDTDGGKLILLVDGEGFVYRGSNYDAKMIGALPYLDGVGLKRADKGFQRIEGMDTVAALLAEAQVSAPHLYRSWKVVSLEDAPNIIVRSRSIRETLFEPKDFLRQLSRLDYVVDYYRGKVTGPLPSVDLTLGAQVPVKTPLFAKQ